MTSSRVVKGVRSSYEAVPVDNIDAAVRSDQKKAAAKAEAETSRPEITIEKTPGGKADKAANGAPEPPKTD